MTIRLVWTREAFIWKLLAVDVQPSGRQGYTIWTWPISGKIFSEIFGYSIAQLSVWTVYDYCLDVAQFYQAKCSFEPSAYR
jgi:hypothetical protein